MLQNPANVAKVPHLQRHGHVTNEALGEILLWRREIGSRVQKVAQNPYFPILLPEIAENSNSSIVLTLILSVVRGHLKSSHIADKRKNFHMALYPLPPQTKVWSTMGEMYAKSFNGSKMQSPRLRQ